VGGGANTVVTKLRASTGAVVATISGVISGQSEAAAFDGANMWIANTQNGLVYKF
jgi:hypothetical protein